MILILENKATPKEIEEVTEVYKGYTKVVVDIVRKRLAAGGEYHIDCEEVLLADGSKQSDLWGGGFRFENNEVDFMALTNFKTDISHLTYEISLPDVRKVVEELTKKIFSNEQK